MLGVLLLLAAAGMETAKMRMESDEDGREGKGGKVHRTCIRGRQRL